MTRDSAIPHRLASGEVEYLRAGQRIQIRARKEGERPRLAEVADPSARKGEGVRVRLYYRSRGRFAKSKVFVPSGEIVAVGWQQ